MRKPRILWQLVGLIVVLALALAACGGDTTDTETTEGAEPLTEEEPLEELEETTEGVADEPTTVSLWFHSGRGAERDALNQILSNFADEHPNITVDAVELPEGSYNDQVQAAAFANDLPCLLDFDGPNLYNYVWGGFLLPLDDYVSDEMRNDFLQSIIDQGTFQDGNLYSLGQFDSGLAIWARQSYLEEAGVRIPTIEEPWTREEFNDALAALEELPEVEYALDLKINYGRGEWFTYGFAPILWSADAGLIDRDDYQSADGVLNSPEAVEAMEMVQNWFENGYVNPEPAGDTEFIDGDAALSWVGHWVANQYQEELGDDLLLLPMADFGDGPQNGMGSWNWGLTPTCPNPDAAWEVLSFLMEPEQILIMTDANGAVPARQSALAMSDQYGEGEMLNLFIEQNEEGFTVPRPITPAYPAITTAFAEAFDNIKDGADVEEELNAAVEEIDSDIEANDGYPLN